MRKFDLSLRSSRSSYFATFRHQLTILSKTDALDEEKWLNMLGKFVKDWFRYESHFVHGSDSLVATTTESYTLSLHDALPISRRHRAGARSLPQRTVSQLARATRPTGPVRCRTRPRDRIQIGRAHV